MRDLVVLVPDKNTEHVVRGALARPQSLAIRPVDFAVLVDPGRDGGVRRRGSQVLQVERNRFDHALLILDHEGSGAEGVTALELEAQLDRQLSTVWHGCAKAIVIEPELDVWMWGAESHIRDVAGWEAPGTIRGWLRDRGFLFHANEKPTRPKEALDEVFRKSGTPRSASAYEAIAKRISLARCGDEAFFRLRQALGSWFAV